jgi:hypothetical protein
MLKIPLDMEIYRRPHWAEDLDLTDENHKPSTFHENPEVLAFYGCKISTDKGEIVIDYRNDSNGYYGGNLSWPDDKYFYGGVYKQNVSAEVWRDVNGKAEHG